MGKSTPLLGVFDALEAFEVLPTNSSSAGAQQRRMKVPVDAIQDLSRGISDLFVGLQVAFVSTESGSIWANPDYAQSLIDWPAEAQARLELEAGAQLHLAPAVKPGEVVDKFGKLYVPVAAQASYGS